MARLIAEIGDTIRWTFDDTPQEIAMFRGKTFESEVLRVDDEGYHVYAAYGHDIIPFDQALFIC